MTNPDTPNISGGETTRSKLKALAIIAFILGGGCVMFLVNPTSAGFFPKCLMYAITGLYCPGCGSARASHELLHGHVGQAADYNILFVIAMPVVGYYFLSNVLVLAGGKPLPEPKITAAVAWILVVAVFLFMALRNIPAYPFNILAP